MHGDVGSLLIRAQQAQCVLTRVRRIPSEYIDSLLSELHLPEHIKSICMKISSTEQSFIHSVVHETSELNQVSFIAYCGANYCMTAKNNVREALRGFLNTRDTHEFDSSTEECVICCEHRKSYSSLWTCIHTICDHCCLTISASQYKNCPLCRSALVSTLTTDSPISVVPETMHLLDMLAVHEEELIALIPKIRLV